MGLLETIKQTSAKAVEAGNPAQVLYGTVEKADPLEIRIHEKLKLTEDFLDVAKHLTRHERIVSIQFENPKTWTEAEIGDAVKTTSSNQGFSNYEMKYAKMIFEDGLKIDDKVVLLRIQGGHRFYVLDRYREGEKIWSYPKEK